MRVFVATPIAAGIDRVWADVARLETHAEWMVDAESIEFVGHLRQGPGTTMRVRTRVGPLRTTDVIRVVSWDPPHRIGVVHEGLVTGTGEFRLSPEGANTSFSWEENLHIPWFLGGPVASLPARVVLTAVWRRNLARLAGRFREE